MTWPHLLLSAFLLLLSLLASLPSLGPKLTMAKSYAFYETLNVPF